MNNFRKLIIVTSVLLFHMSGSISWADFRWADEAGRLDQYKNIYVYSIDVREMTIISFDDEEQESIEEPIDSTYLEEVAQMLYDRLVIRLKDILPVNPEQTVDPSIKSLVLNLRISAQFEMDDGRLLNQWIHRSGNEPTDIHIEGILKDSRDDAVLLTFKDTQSFSAETDSPLTTKKDLEQFGRVLDYWARTFAGALADRMLDE